VPTKSLETTCHFSNTFHYNTHVVSNLITPMHVQTIELYVGTFLEELLTSLDFPSEFHLNI